MSQIEEYRYIYIYNDTAEKNQFIVDWLIQCQFELGNFSFLLENDTLLTFRIWAVTIYMYEAVRLNCVLF